GGRAPGGEPRGPSIGRGASGGRGDRRPLASGAGAPYSDHIAPREGGWGRMGREMVAIRPFRHTCRGRARSRGASRSYSSHFAPLVTTTRSRGAVWSLSRAGLLGSGRAAT